jgi:prepilin-type N-terminal cleavage/methylation domain-containing protein
VPRREMGRALARARGFTLLEVLVALLIFGLAFGVLAQIFQTGFRQSETAEELTTATLLARSRLARIGTDLALEIGESEEEAEDGFRVRTSVEPAELDVEADQFVPLLVEVIVAWGPIESERQVALTTLRLAPARPDGASQ